MKVKTRIKSTIKYSLGCIHKSISLIGGDTCINPDVHTTRMPNIPWRKMGDGWFSNLRGGFQVKYKEMYF